MDIIQAIILGVVEGLTEFLPISSTGHLIVAEHLLKYKDTAEIFTVVVQMGAMLAVIWFYWADLIDKITGVVRRDRLTINFWASWVIATIPAALLGFILKDLLSKYAVALTVGTTLLVGGILIWLIESFHKAPPPDGVKPHFEKIDLKTALKIGFYQILALVPGVSRSGATIMGGVLSGLDRVTATAFSFYLGIPILLAAGTYQLIKGREELSTVAGGGPALLAGTIASFLTAFVAIKWLLHYVSHHNLKPFAYYRIILGLLILTAIATR